MFGGKGKYLENLRTAMSVQHFALGIQRLALDLLAFGQLAVGFKFLQKMSAFAAECSLLSAKC
jgi:hypothetical protein